MLKKEATAPLRTAQDLEQFTVNLIAAGQNPGNENQNPNSSIPAGKPTSEDDKRSSSVPTKIRGFTLRADTKWRKGDPAQGRDPWRPEIIAGDSIKDAIYPQWWFDPDNGTKQAGIGDELDLKIEKTRARNS